jgi:hypothetical protein
MGAVWEFWEHTRTGTIRTLRERTSIATGRARQSTEHTYYCMNVGVPHALHHSLAHQ